MGQAGRGVRRLWVRRLGMAGLPVLAISATVWADGGNHRGGAATDPAKVVGPERCAECHEAEYAVWKQTHHAVTFREMHRKAGAKEIVKKLGGARIKRNEHCLTCHYTEGLKSGKPRAMWGVTCESCHGQAAEWEKVHSDYGGKDVKKDQETAAQVARRLGGGQ